MDSYNDHSNNKHSDKSRYVQKITQILFSLSLCSFFFYKSSLFVQSYDHLVSNFNFNFKLFSYTTERNCIFLLCNGILVLIIQSSGVISKITPAKTGHHAEKEEGIERFQENEKKGLGKDRILEEKTSADIAVEEAEGEDDEDLLSRRIEEEEEEEDEGIDADELNKKFEDFIKKMKKEILCA